METIQEYAALVEAIQNEDLVFVYVSQPQCSVCVSLLPKVEELLQQFSKISSYYLNTHEVPVAAGQLSVFSIPTVLFFVQGKEQFRLVRTFGITEIKEKIDRIYEHFA